MCHLTSERQSFLPLFSPDTDIPNICLNCHNYRENHHPIDITPEKTYFINTDITSLPLYKKQIKCLTCHVAHISDDYIEPPKLLRGGPYADRREICFKCHYKERYAEIYVHYMLDEGKIRKIDGLPVCLFCHAVVPDPEKDRTGDVKFKADVAFLCWRCHPPMPGQFFTKHFLVSPSNKIKKALKESQKKFEVIFPLVPRDRITCSTCHNPHQVGVIKSKPAQKGADAPERLRLPKTEICKACHLRY